MRSCLCKNWRFVVVVFCDVCIAQAGITITIFIGIYYPGLAGIHVYLKTPTVRKKEVKRLRQALAVTSMFMGRLWRIDSKAPVHDHESKRYRLVPNEQQWKPRDVSVGLIRSAWQKTEVNNWTVFERDRSDLEDRIGSEIWGRMVLRV